MGDSVEELLERPHPVDGILRSQGVGTVIIALVEGIFLELRFCSQGKDSQAGGRDKYLEYQSVHPN
jgi:hypothetical protein